MTNLSTRLRKRSAAVLLALWLAGALSLAPLAAAPRGDGAFKRGRAAELNKDYDKALELYQQAEKEDPENQAYIMAVRRMRFVAGQTHVDFGHRLLNQGKLEEAVAEFQKALTIDPASSIAEQELQRTVELIAKRKKQQKKAEAGQPEPGVPPLVEEKKESEALLETAQSVPKLKPLSTQPINLKASNNSKVIFETIGKLAGVNVLFDPEYQGSRVTVELNNATLHEALDYVATITKSYWKPLSPNAIFVTMDNTTKRRDYEDYVIKTFYLSNPYTAQELQEIATAVRSVALIRSLFTVNSLNAMVIRGTADQVALAEKIVNDVDKARAEVIIDVLVLETSRTRSREFGITPLSGTTPGINSTIAVDPVNPVVTTTQNQNNSGQNAGTTTTTTTTGTATTGGLLNFGKTDVVDFAVALPSVGVKALLSRSDTRVLQSPRVRGFDGIKASLRIGDRIPIATGSFQPGIGGVGINPLVNTQFNYQDVGVVLDILPRIHFGKEVSMHIEIEISNVRDRIDIGGIKQPIIGQRKIIHDIRLREGEASIVGGLMQSQTTRTVSGVPGLASIPLLGRLFSNESVERSDNEILIALVPHVVRVPELTDLNMKEIVSGTEQTVRINFAEPPNDHPALPPIPPAPQPAAPAAAPPAPAAPPKPAPRPGAPAPPEGAAPPAPTPAAAPLTANRSENIVPQLRLEPAQANTTVGGRVTLNLILDNVTELFAVPVRIRYNPKMLHLADARKGALLSSDGQDIIFSKNILEDTGEASFNLARFPGAGGISGGGVLLTLDFQAASAGTSTVDIATVTARNAKLDEIPLGAASAQVAVKEK